MLNSYLILLFTLFGLLACGQSDEPVEIKQALDSTHRSNNSHTPTVKNSVVVANVGDDRIELKELDKAVQFALFDLEWRKYQIRKDMLGRMVTQRQAIYSEGTNELVSTEILLSPPSPPRITLIRDKRPIRGNQNSVILSSVFCSYQSSHCARLQTVIQQLETYYQEIISFNFYDLPQGFHRYGVAAANAYHCAKEAGEPWAYQSALYSDTSKLDKPRLMHIAEQLQFDMKFFESCLDENTYFSTIKSDMDLAKTLGLSNVPVMFINGLYAKGPQSFESYQYYIDQELARLGHEPKSSKETELIESTLPITLLATSVSSDPSSSTALIRLPTNDIGAHFNEGELLLDQVRLVKIEAHQILIDNNGSPEFLKLQTSIGHDITALESNSSEQHSPAQPETVPPTDEKLIAAEMKRRELPKTGEMPLSKEWLETQLINQTQLEQHFFLAEHKVEGVHLIKLDQITDQRFYNTLGFKTSDVLLRVNDQWVHENHNPLWDALAKEEDVSVVIMRGGFPIRLDYKIK